MRSFAYMKNVLPRMSNFAKANPSGNGFEPKYVPKVFHDVQKVFP